MSNSRQLGEDGHEAIFENRTVDDDRITPAPTTSIIPGARDHNGDIEITATQKMLSAMSGSLLTSLIVTPLDVVRVRLQSQAPDTKSGVQTTKASIQRLGASKLPIPIPAAGQLFQNQPPNLGVTACCREVFFMNSNAEVCIAGTRLGGFGPDIIHNGAGCAVEETRKRTINSTFDGLRKIARNEGITTLWRGLSPTLIMTIPANIIYFTGYDYLRFNKSSPVNRALSDSYSPLIAGSTARIMAAIVVSPVEMFRTRMQASQSGSKHPFSETLTGVKEMVAARGYTSLWRGLTLTLWRDVPFSGIYWWGYETVKQALGERRERGRSRDQTATTRRSRSQSRDDHTATFVDSFIAGALSGAVASVMTMPFDVGKTRQQVFKDARSSASDATTRALAPEELSMPRFLYHIFKQEGFAGLWRGWVPRTLKVAPACAIMISSYEVGKRMAISVNERAAERASSAI